MVAVAEREGKIMEKVCGTVLVLADKNGNRTHGTPEIGTGRLGRHRVAPTNKSAGS